MRRSGNPRRRTKIGDTFAAAVHDHGEMAFGAHGLNGFGEANEKALVVKFVATNLEDYDKRFRDHVFVFHVSAFSFVWLARSGRQFHRYRRRC